ncbi:MAG: hypothetical protein K0S42_1343, partial [Microvirga sp.]|nr:hypothetical protein [Microvirga sp.]
MAQPGLRVPDSDDREGSPVASVEIRNIQKSFGPVSVIQGVSFDIEDGEFVT